MDRNIMSWINGLIHRLGGHKVNPPTPTPPTPTPPTPTPPTPTPATPTPVIKPQKFAVITAVNKYITLPENTLSGCVNDGNTMVDLLTTTYNFPRENIITLFDEQATKQNIINKLTWLISMGKDGSELVWYNSSHGTIISRVDGSGSDEAIVCTDFDWDHPFIDDDVAAIFKPLNSNAFLSCIIDSCHSGHATGEKDLTRTPRRNKYVRPPQRIMDRVKIEHVRKFGARDLAANTQRHILLSGCGDDQTSAETSFGGVDHGALTYFLTYTLRNSPVENWVTVHNNVTTNLSSNGFTQIPNLLGSATLRARNVFGGR